MLELNILGVHDAEMLAFNGLKPTPYTLNPSSIF